MSSPKTVAISLPSPQVCTLVLDMVTAQNLLLALTNAMQTGGREKQVKKGKDGKGK